MASVLLISPGDPLSVSLPVVGEGTRFVLPRVRGEGRGVLQLRAHAVMADSCDVGEEGPAESPSSGPHLQYF